MEHSFTLRAEWTGNRGTGTSGYKDYDRDMVIQAEGPGELQGSAARAFHGSESRWNPEQLLLAALAECHLLSYLQAATEAGLVIARLSTRASCTLELGPDGGRVSSATLVPDTWLAEGGTEQREQAAALHATAHERCFIARSVGFPVALEPDAVNVVSDGPTAGSRLGAPIAVTPYRPAKRPAQVSGMENRSADVEPEVGSARPTLPISAAAPAPQQEPGDRGQVSFYEAVGGHETFVKLCRVFYEGVVEDPLLRPMYPEEDLGPAEERLRMFLEQYWGGPKTYGERRGHPRLRMRHLPFTVDSAARDAWLKHMRTAVDSLDLAPLHEQTLWDYLERAAHSMVNSA